MTELRRSGFRREWVIIAPERGGRPMVTETAEHGGDEVGSDRCPFCPGNESMTPREICRLPGPDDTWAVRVVPNRFPALADCKDGERRSSTGLSGCREGNGAHEVVIETPDHRRQLADLSASEIERVFEAIILRLRALIENPEHRYVLVFKNHGRDAGASLFHSHSQILAMPIVPEAIRSELRMASAFLESEGRCIFCDTLEEELHDGRRVVDEGDGFATVVPYDARVPFEVAIYPLQHQADFGSIDDTSRHGLAKTLNRALARLRSLHGDVPYTLVLQTVPNPLSNSDGETWVHAYHWRLELLPRTGRLGGVEWGTGVHINTVRPEEAARVLRDAGGGA